MRKFIRGQFYLLFAGILLCMFSCTSESCLEDTEAFLKANFFNDATGLLDAPDSITIYGINMESDKIYNKTPNIETALLPLNPSTGSSVYIIRINGVTDTLELKYNSYPHLISRECGYSFYHSLDTSDPAYSENIIKYIYVKKATITTLNEENIRIFY